MSISSNDRDLLLSQKADEIENDLQLLGVIGIEDHLQEGVQETIVALREGGVQVWVLTGDKLETAENIARSCGLFDSHTNTKTIQKREDLSTVGNGRAKAVLCYRMTPSEKAEIVKL
ncbi:unnamed protein product, partial [Nippostrongylus brasiliensis]|uniref:Phospholipid-transporting ATPase tat-1 (inferred by orthology to a C. elegans protein) n=1 Tax=Nippostrongylus brasiliensis TaxID=27835 RepID=A0A0N4YY05_NIPBR